MINRPQYSFSCNQIPAIFCLNTAPLSFSKISLMMLSLSLTPAFSDEAAETKQQAEPQTSGYIEGGIGYQSDDSPWFGRYTGLSDEGNFLYGDMDILSKKEDGTRTQLTGRRLGLDSRSLLLEHGVQGRYKLKLRHDEMPNYRSNSGVTPYIDSGDNILVLPGGVFNTESYQTVELSTVRRRNQAEISVTPTQNWKTSLSYRQEHKDGTLQTGGALGYSTRTMSMATLARPVDHTTDLIDASLGYAGKKGNLELGYHLSMFRNQNQSLSWQNPFPGSSVNSGAFGQLALEPDNDFHQIMLSGGYRLPGNSYLSGALSSGRMTQDQAFLPYSTDPSLATDDLPANSLNGEIKQNIAQLKLSARPLRDWSFNAAYRYHDHDNNTPQAMYVFPLLDSQSPGETGKDEDELTAVNQPLSYTRQTTRLDGKYRFNRHASLQMGYDFENMRRENSEVDELDEQTLWGKLKWKLGDGRTDGWIKLGHLTRDGSGYHFPDTDQQGLYIENPLLRKYNLADLERDEVRFQFNYTPVERLSFAANLAYSEDQYEESLIGLTAASNRSATIEGSYVPTDKVTTYAYYTRDLIDSEQSGREAIAGNSGSLDERYAPDWFAQTRDSMDSLGLGLQWQEFLPKLSMGADYVYSKGDGETDIQLAAASPFPDIQTRLHTFSLYTSYQRTRNLSFRLHYRHEQYQSQDWALDGVTPLSTDSPTSLYMAEGSPQYDVDLVGLSMRYTF